MEAKILLLFVAVATGKWVKEMENPGMFEGDMVLTPEQTIAARSGKLGYATTKSNHWPTTIYYDWEPALANNRGILAAIADYEEYTCLRFIKRTNQRNYMYFYVGGGCSSGVGFFNNGRHSISIGRGCTGKGTVIHEMAHRLGIYHEQSRPDRDNYITVQYQNIYPNMAYNFYKQSDSKIDSLGTAYDYLSVMHYADWGFSKNGKPTIITKDPAMQKKIGNRAGFSDIDKIQINKLYRCDTGPTQVPTQKPPTETGFLIKHSGGRCLAVDTNNQLYLTSQCSTRFEEIKGGQLRVPGSTKCAYPKHANSNSMVYFKERCGHTFLKTDQQSDGYFAIKNVNTGKCFHPNKGSGRPREGTKVVIYTGCNELRLKFKQV